MEQPKEVLKYSKSLFNVFEVERERKKMNFSKAWKLDEDKYYFYLKFYNSLFKKFYPSKALKIDNTFGGVF